MKKIYLSLLMVWSTTALFTQTFTNSTNLLPASHNSGGCTGVTDMNNDGLDDIIILDQSLNLNVAYQQANGTFTVSAFGTVSNENQWGMAVGDVDNDGHKDVICGGSYDQVHVVNINGPDDFVQVNYAWADIFMQGCNFSDIDNDGWLDGFGCHDDGHSAIMRNDGTGTLVNGASLMDLTFYPEINGNDNSGNYGSVWTDFDRDGDIDLFIAKCRQFINDPYDPRRTNVLMVNDGNGNYTEEAMQRGLVNLQQSWTSDFADMDNDGDWDILLTTHSGTLEIYSNDGTGYFTNVIAGSGLEVSGFFLQAKMADFDNDGFMDLIHSGGTHRYFHNNGDMTWTLVNDTFVNDDTMHSFGIGDLNNDGWMDVYASYGNGYNDADMDHPDQLFINDGGTNNYIIFDLQGTISNMDAAGATVEIHGPWGVQLREIRDGESYGITNTSKCHFGIGAETMVDYAVIYWPSGGMKVIDNPTINTVHIEIEGACTPPTASITAGGPTNFCAGNTVTLSIATAGTNYLWSNGAQTNSITVGTPGNYSLIVWDNTGCAASSNQLLVTNTTDPIPTITVSGELEFCSGQTVQLIASAGTSFLWNNGLQTQAITVTEAGDYSATVTGACQQLPTATISVVVHDSPVIPSVTDVTINSGNSATFTVFSSSNILWFDSATSTTPIFEGASFVTPALTETTSYWAEAEATTPVTLGTGGKTTNSPTTGNYQQNTGYYLLFDVMTDVNLNTVKVYANGAGDRGIEVINSNGTTIASGTFTIPDGESVVALNFFIPQGNDYGIRITSNNPQLWRDRDLTNDTPFNFPYAIGSLVSITGTNVGGADSDNYYYFFYDWTVSTPTWTCTSGRVEVQAIVTGVNELTGVESLNVYPNPTSDVINVNMNVLTNAKLTVSLLDQTGRVVKTEQWSTSNGNNAFSMDVNNIAKGIYQLSFSSEGKSVTRKIVIQ